MGRLALLVALLLPALASAFEPGEEVVCIRSWEGKEGEKPIGILPGTPLTVAAEKDGRVKGRSADSKWWPADHFLAKKDALAFFRAQIARDPDDVEARCGLARMLSKSGDVEAALKEVNEAVRRKKNATTLECQALVLFDRADWNGAIAALTEAVKLEPRREPLYQSRAAVYAKAGRYQEAADEFTTILKVFGESAEVLGQRASAFVFLGEFDKAEADLEAGERLDPGNPELEDVSITIDIRRGRYGTALTRLDDFLSRHPENLNGQYNRGVILQMQRHHDDAIKAFSRVLEIDPRQTRALSSRAQSWLQLGKLDQALDDITKAIELRPTSPEYRYGRIQVLKAMHGYDRALADLDEAIRLLPSSKDLLAVRLELYIETGKYAQAIKEMERLHKEYPDADQLNCKLAWLYATCPEKELRNGGKARDLVIELYELGGDWDGIELRSAPKEMPNAPDILAAAYAELGDFKRAVEVQEVAVRISRGVKDEQAIRDRLALYQAHQPYRLPTKKR